MTSEPSKVPGWLKTIGGTVAGVLSGAVVMYVSPLVEKAVKPAKPVANFAVEHDGLTATFQNRSTGGSQGWWDFGDGSALEPVVPQQQVLTHSYLAPGDYTAKLTLRNLIGEETERAVTVRLDAPRSDPPQILSLELAPVSSGAYAPATFRVTAKTKNAQLCIWDVGDDRPLEISADTPDNQDRLVTFDKPGGYVVKMAAVNGGQAVERSDIVYVNEPPPGTVAATLSVTDQATRVDTLSLPYTFYELFPPDEKETVHAISHQVPARPGFEIVDVRLKSATGPGLKGASELVLDSATAVGTGARDLRLQLASDGRSVRLIGELVKDAGTGKTLPTVSCPVVLVQERRTRTGRPAVPVTGTLSVPGSALLTLPPLPANWAEAQRQLRLDLHDGDRSVWQGSQLPTNALVTFNNRRYSLTARPVGNQVRVDLVEAPLGVSPAAN